MANNHRVAVNSGSLPFAAYPIQLSTTTPFTINYAVESTGGIIRSSGNRIYDTSILAAIGSTIVQPGLPLVFPFIANQLPSTYFDAVLLLNINSNRYLQGFSNSPDNAPSYTSNYFLEDKKMFGVFLKCFGANGALGNFNTNNHYMFGGENSSSNGSLNLRMVFDAPTLTTITITPKIIFYGVGILAPTLVRPTVTIPAGSIEFLFPIFNLYGEYTSVTGYYVADKTGYYKVEFVSSDPSYVSILPFYHWGQSG